MSAALPVSIEDIRDAATRLDGVANRTPVVTSRTLNAHVGAEVFLKCENFQRMGAFKFRGAYNAAAGLSAEQRQRGIVAFSSGNHAQAVALAARELGTHAVILMPEDAPSSKRDATVGYGAEVIGFDRYSQDRDELARELARERGLALIPPYDHPDVIAGQGTTALELCREVGGLDTLVAPIGGGGLMAGCATVAKALNPSSRVIGVEPEAADDTKRSLARGERVGIPVPQTIADGLAAATPGELTFDINQRLVDSVELVGEDEIIAAMRFAFDRLRIVVEPSGATVLAAIMSGRIDAAGERIGLIVSGGNIDAERFSHLIAGSRAA